MSQSQTAQDPARQRSGKYHPLTGAGLGGGDFSWTAAMWLAWIDDAAQPDRLTPG
jgi:hypothetical protein